MKKEMAGGLIYLHGLSSRQIVGICEAMRIYSHALITTPPLKHIDSTTYCASRSCITCKAFTMNN